MTDFPKPHLHSSANPPPPAVQQATVETGRFTRSRQRESYRSEGNPPISSDPRVPGRGADLIRPGAGTEGGARAGGIGGLEGGSGRRGKSGRPHVKSEPGLHGVPSSNKVGPVESASDKDANMDQASFADVHAEADPVMEPQQHRSRRAESPPRQEKGKGKRVAENTPDQEEEGGEES